jgi:hypothetical protein
MENTRGRYRQQHSNGRNTTPWGRGAVIGSLLIGVLLPALVTMIWCGPAHAAAPTLTTPATANPGANQATLTLQSDATGTGYFTLLSGSGAACGTGTQVKAGQDSGGNPAVRRGSLPLVANAAGSYTVRNLIQSTSYTVCFTADDGTTVQSTPATADLTTTAAATFAVPGWGVWGSAGFSPQTAADTSLAFAPDGTPYVAF